MKVKTRELIGEALDWAVAKVEGRINRWLPLGGGTSVVDVEVFQGKPWAYVGVAGRPDYKLWAPSVDWSQSGPIIEREAHNLFKHNDGTEWCCACSVQRDGYTAIVTADGPTPLIAAMRCYVASKLGDEVEIPDILAQGDKL